MKITAALVIIAFAISAQGQTSNDNPKLKDALKRFPQADANGDGVLTTAEAKAFKKKGASKSDPGSAQQVEASTDPEVLRMYEAREFEGVKYRLLRPIDLAKNPDQKYPLILSLHGAAGIGNDKKAALAHTDSGRSSPLASKSSIGKLSVP
jgi:predicted peptidase